MGSGRASSVRGRGPLKSQCLFSTFQAESQVVAVLVRMLGQIRGTISGSLSDGYGRGGVRKEFKVKFTLQKGDGEIGRGWSRKSIPSKQPHLASKHESVTPRSIKHL